MIRLGGRHTLVLPAAGVVLFVFVAVSAVRGHRALEGLAFKRSSALKSHIAAVELRAAVKDVEIRHRDAAPVGDASNAAEARYAGLFAQLDERAAAVPALARRLPRLRELAVQHGAGTSAAESRQTAAALRLELEALERDLGLAVADIESDLYANVTGNRWLIVLSTLIGLASLLGGAALLRREAIRRGVAEDALAETNRFLETRIVERTAELRAVQAQMEQTAAHLDRSLENERRRLAREVHDQIGQLFTALKLSLPPAGASLPPAQRDDLLALADEGVATARRIASELRPTLLDDFGLGAALAQRGRRFVEETRIDCTVDVVDSDRLGIDQATQLYRIACEAMTNAARHASARRVRIDARPEGDRYLLDVEDDGQGLPGPPSPESMGCTACASAPRWPVAMSVSARGAGAA